MGIYTAVAGTQVHVVEVEQQSASATLDNLVEKVRLVHLANERQVVGRIFDQDAAPDRILVPAHALHQSPQRVAGSGQW